jgi:hypothetical protein
MRHDIHKLIIGLFDHWRWCRSAAMEGGEARVCLMNPSKFHERGDSFYNPMACSGAGDLPSTEDRKGIGGEEDLL